MENLTNILTDDKKLQEVYTKIEELKILVEAEGGLREIAKNKAATSSKLSIADKILKDANQKAEIIIEKATKEADEILNTSKERYAQRQLLLDNSFAKSAEIEVALNKEKASLNKGWTSLRSEAAELKSRSEALDKREEKIAKIEKLVEQFKELNG